MRELTFAGRLGTIDRLTNEPPADFVKRYTKLLQSYMDVEKLIGILSGDAGYEKLHNLLIRAKEVSLSESDKTTVYTTKRNLTSVFSRLSIDDNSVSEKYYYNLLPFELENAFPRKNLNVTATKDLLTSFYKEMDFLSANPPSDYKDFEIIIDRIFMKYLWCITSSDYEGEDISLYDHTKVTEAILNCLVQTSDEQETAYCMLMGDFSGIQKYIFGISSTNQSNVAKRLRARSFYVDILIRVFATYVSEIFHVNKANILQQTGGKFYLLVPNTTDLEERMESLRDELDRFLYTKFHGSVSLNLAWITVSDDGLKEYSETIVELNQRLSASKNNSFSSIIKPNGKWDENAFLLYNDLSEKHLCQGCGSALISVSKVLCDQCSEQIEIGRQLAGADYIIWERKPSGKNFCIFKDYYIRFTNKVDFTNAFVVESLKSWHPDKTSIQYPITQKYMANHVPRDAKGTICTFSEIAQNAAGMKKLAVLKADVDVLGYLFSEGFRKLDRHFGTISRVNTMSRMMEVFFSGYINKLLENEKEFQNVYSVFSGGDDLFLIGPWDVMPALTLKIQDSFRRFFGYNTCVTLSASITLFNEKEHIAFMAERSEELLKYAKNGDSDTLGVLYKGRGGRNCICFMENLFTWDDFKEQMQLVNTFSSLLRKKAVSSEILRRISQYSFMYRRFLIDKDVFGLMFDSLLSYDKNRNYKSIRKNNDNENEVNAFLNYVKEIQIDTADYRRPKKNLYYANVVVKCALNMTRTERNNGK